MARATAVKMPPEASAVHGCEGARRVLALMLAFSADKNTLTARDLAAATGIALPSVYRYITLLRETGLLAGDERGSNTQRDNQPHRAFSQQGRRQNFLW